MTGTHQAVVMVPLAAKGMLREATLVHGDAAQHAANGRVAGIPTSAGKLL